MNPDPSLDSIGLPHELDATSKEMSWEPFKEKLAQIDSKEMQRLASDVYKQAGTICWTKEEFAASEHGKANAHVGLWELHSHPNPSQKPGWWPDSPLTGIKRPLAGLKVLDITRVIAAPSITRGLAEMGASVMRVTAPHLVDFSNLHCDLNWGKWNTCLDLRKREDRKKMRELILDADVVVEGYRPGVLDKWGLGRENILKICEGRGKGVIYVRENCYGWNGPWSYRSGWQQISDAVCSYFKTTIVILTLNSVVECPWNLVERWAMMKPSLPSSRTQITAQVLQELPEFSLPWSNAPKRAGLTALMLPSTITRNGWSTPVELTQTQCGKMFGHEMDAKFSDITTTWVT